MKALIGLMIALALPLAVLGPAMLFGGDLPPINDITTDLEDQRPSPTRSSFPTIATGT